MTFWYLPLKISLWLSAGSWVFSVQSCLSSRTVDAGAICTSNWSPLLYLIVSLTLSAPCSAIDLFVLKNLIKI